jgi:hypothetical protein
VAPGDPGREDRLTSGVHDGWPREVCRPAVPRVIIAALDRGPCSVLARRAGSPGSWWWAVAADGLPGGAAGLGGAVRVHDQFPAELVQQRVVVPAAEVLDVDQAGPAAVGAVHHVVRFTGRGGLVTPA